MNMLDLNPVVHFGIVLFVLFALMAIEVGIVNWLRAEREAAEDAEASERELDEKGGKP